MILFCDSRLPLHLTAVSPLLPPPRLVFDKSARWMWSPDWIDEEDWFLWGSLIFQHTTCESIQREPGCSARHQITPQHHCFLALRYVAVMVPLVRSHFITSRLLACQCAPNRVEEVISQRLGANSFKCESFSITSKSIHHIHSWLSFFHSSPPPHPPPPPKRL